MNTAVFRALTETTMHTHEFVTLLVFRRLAQTYGFTQINFTFSLSSTDDSVACTIFAATGIVGPAIAKEVSIKMGK